MLAAKADVEALKNLTLITEDLARYENTRDPNCKGIKDCETLRGVRTGADAGLARLRKTARAKSRHLHKSTAGDFATTAMDSVQSSITNRLAENSRDHENSRWANQTRIATAGE